MRQSELNRAIVLATGESLQTIRRHGFQLHLTSPSPACDTCLGLDCPGCGELIAIARHDGGADNFAECERCDAVFPFGDHELYVSDQSLELAMCG